MFGSAQFDIQFGYYSALVGQVETLKEELVYKAHESASPAHYDPFDVYGSAAQTMRPSAGLVILGPDQPSTTGMKKQVNVYIHPGRPTSIACPECGMMSDFPAEQVANLNGAVNVKCSCSKVFIAFFERRRHFRKAVQIYGKYKSNGRVELQPMLVKDISRGGLCFEVLAEDLGPLTESCDIRVTDTVFVEFRLDDDKRSIIRGEVAVRSVFGTRIGGEFALLDSQAKKDLGFYFMS
jgi:hypothetical protein